ncbi:hypothetical protein BURKHO8Y_550003 [Burkholderia sp. 8Y]|nr:hypothetical protein BURKHO8Y_550003 [Burkholderia sp. 8Y]
MMHNALAKQCSLVRAQHIRRRSRTDTKRCGNCAWKLKLERRPALGGPDASQWKFSETSSTNLGT